MKAIFSYVQGGRHLQQERPCQDRAFAMEDRGVYAIALSDGAGNPRYTFSEEGADCVTRTMAQLLCTHFEELWGAENESEAGGLIVSVCQKALRQRAEELGADSITRLSCTMLAAAEKDGRLILCHLGDGVIGGIDGQSSVVLSRPDNGEFASTTFFMASPDAFQHVRVQRREVGNLNAVFLMSDGTSDYTYNEEDNSFVSGIFSMAAMVTEEDGSEQLDKTIRTFMTEADPHSDDCSFAVLELADSWRPQAAKPDDAARSQTENPVDDVQPQTENPEDAAQSQKGWQPGKTKPDDKSQKAGKGKNSGRNRKTTKMFLFGTAGIIVLAVLAIGMASRRFGDSHGQISVSDSEVAGESAAENETAAQNKTAGESVVESEITGDFAAGIEATDEHATESGLKGTSAAKNETTGASEVENEVTAEPVTETKPTGKPHGQTRKRGHTRKRPAAQGR